MDGDTVKTLSPSSLTNETATRDKFTQAILIREKDDANADIVVIPAAAPAQIPSGSNGSSIAGAYSDPQHRQE